MNIFASLAVIVMMAFPVESKLQPIVGTIMAEKLYYAEGRQHPNHPLHGSYEGLWAGE